MSFLAGAGRPDLVARNTDADDDSDVTVSTALSAPTLVWSGAAATSPSLLILPGCSASSAFLDAAFPSPHAPVVASFGSAEVRRVALSADGTAFALIVVPGKEVPPSLASLWPMQLLTALTPLKCALFPLTCHVCACARTAARVCPCCSWSH